MSKRIYAKRHIDLALRYLEEGRSLADKDPVQASEKLYKAAEEAVKVLAMSFNMEDILKIVGEKGRRTATQLEKAVSRISKEMGEWFSVEWDRQTTYTFGASRGNSRKCYINSNSHASLNNFHTTRRKKITESLFFGETQGPVFALIDLITSIIRVLVFSFPFSHL